MSDNNKSIWERLAAPMPYTWKIQTASEYGAACVAYVDARDVQNRLDEVLTPIGWYDEYEEISGQLFCRLYITHPKTGEWVGKMDTGTAGNFESEKSTVSDAFKRTAVKWGVGRFLYAMAKFTFRKNEMAQNSKGKWIPAPGGQPIYGSKALNAYIEKVLKTPATAVTARNTTVTAAPQKPAEKPKLTDDQFTATLGAIMDGNYNQARNVLNQYDMPAKWRETLENSLNENDKS